MSREIKFRAWNSIDKVMCDNSTTLSNIRVFMKSKHYHLMQFTGLRGVNGVEIYEGDLLYHPRQGIRKVIYPMSDNFAGFGLVDASGRKNTLQDSSELYKVIGNIHQNPELLK